MNVEQMRNAALDSLAFILAMERMDEDSIDALMATYDPTSEDYQLFTSALASHAVLAFRVAAEAKGVPTEVLLGAVANGVRTSDD